MASRFPRRLDEYSAAAGKTLAQLNIRGLTGASVLAIARGEDGVIVPMASEVLRAGDVLALVGTHEAVSAATGAPRPGRPSPASSSHRPLCPKRV